MVIAAAAAAAAPPSVESVVVTAQKPQVQTLVDRKVYTAVSYTHLTLPTIYSV